MSYTIKEASEALGVGTHQVRRYIKQGKIEAKLVPGKFGKEYQIEVLPAELVAKKAKSSTFEQALDLIKGLQEENRNLAGQLGIATEKVRSLEDQVKLLSAPKSSWWQRLFR